MPVFRMERNKGYTVMSNYHLRDKSLSLKAKGLLSQILSLPDGWHDITLEVGGQSGPGCWYISTPGFRDICPIGLFVKWE